MKYWLRELKRSIDNDKYVQILLANKYDMVDDTNRDKTIPLEDIKQLANDHGL